MLHYHPLVAKLLLTSNITNVDKTRSVFLIFFYSNFIANKTKTFTDYYIFFLLKNVTEEFPLLGLAGLYFLPVGSPVDKVGEGKFGPHMASKPI